jgi:hypothetical protein
VRNNDHARLATFLKPVTTHVSAFKKRNLLKKFSFFFLKARQAAPATKARVFSMHRTYCDLKSNFNYFINKLLE